MLDAGFNASELDRNECTTLYYNIKAGSLEVVRLLIARGLNINATALDGFSTIHFESISESTGIDETLKILLNHGADPLIHRNDKSTLINLLIRDKTDEENDLITDETDEKKDSLREQALIRLASLLESF